MPTARRDASLAWVRPKEDPKLVKEIMREFQLHQVTAQILVSRGFKTLPEIHDFLYSQLPDLHDPSLLQQMDVAVDRVCHAIKQGEGILVYG
jgi:single-stranded-DNA-specific exonuclease